MGIVITDPPVPDYATVAGLEARWRELSADERARAAALIADAAAKLRTQCPTVPARLAAETLDPLIPEQVVCAMVRRAMTPQPDLLGVTSASETTGPFSQSAQYANPMGDVYVTKAELRLLGCGGQTAGASSMIPPAAPDPDAVEVTLP